MPFCRLVCLALSLSCLFAESCRLFSRNAELMDDQNDVLRSVENSKMPKVPIDDSWRIAALQRGFTLLMVIVHHLE